MITQEEGRRLVGKRVLLALEPTAGEPDVSGLCVGKIEAADGVVLVVLPDGRPGLRRSIHFQHVAAARPL